MLGLVLGMGWEGEGEGEGVKGVLREVLGRWEEVGFYERSVYRGLGGFLRRAYEAVLEEGG